MREEYLLALLMLGVVAVVEIITRNHPKWWAPALLLAAPGRDDFGQFSDLHRPLSESPWADVTGKLPRDVDFICLDAVYDNADQIFADYQLL